MCSSAARFIAIEDGLPFRRGEETGKRAGLPEPGGVLIGRAQARKQLRERQSVEQPLPLAQGVGRAGGQPPFQVGARYR